MRLEADTGPIYPGIHGRDPYLIAGGSSGSTWVAGTGMAAKATGKIPEVGGTAVTGRALDIGEAWALPTAWVTVAPISGWALLGICAQQVAGTACASQDKHINEGEPEEQNPNPTILSPSTLTVTALSGSLPMEARLAVGTVWPLCVV